MAKIIIETDDIAEARSLLDAIETRTGVKPVVGETQEIKTPVETSETGEPELDSNGMEWDGNIHTSTKTMNADGSWKAARGKAAEAKKAVEDHKAAGGNETPPETPPTTGMPGAETASTSGGMPTGGGMPGAAPAEQDMSPPVSQEQLEAKCVGMMQRTAPGSTDPILSHDKYFELLDKHGIDRADPTGVLATNETLRAAFYADLCDIEPEMA